MIKNLYFWITAIIGLVLDQLTKYIVVQNFAEIGDTVPLLPGIFHFTYVTNTGAAFSLFSQDGGWLRWLSLLVSIGLILLGLSTRLRLTEQIGYGCILAGAAGNGIDRFLAGYVVDFFDFRLIQFAVFNIADVLINLGWILILITIFQESTHHKYRN